MSERLAQFLYLLARDQLPVGALNDLVQRTSDQPTVFCDRHLGQWAKDAAAKLEGDEP